MSRTYRKLPLISYYSFYYNSWVLAPIHYLRALRTFSTKKAEQAAVQALVEEGYYPRPRVRARGNNKGTIPDSWDDYKISAYDELDFNNGQLFKGL